MSRYYDKSGAPITLDEWCRLWGDDEYRRIAEDVLPDGRHVSTVWLGLNHAFGNAEPPLIFETMAFPPDSWRGLEGERYHTEAEARVGHVEMIVRLKRGEPGGTDEQQQ